MKAVCTPTRDMVHAGFAFDLAGLLRVSPDAFFAVGQGSLLPNVRANLVERAIAVGMSHVLFIDSDMRFPHDTLRRLVKHDVDIVGANCKQRMEPHEPTAFKGGQRLSSELKVGLEEVDVIGFGVTLIKTAVFKSMLQPWFSTPWDDGLKKHLGEDVTFCSRAALRSMRVFVDHDLSKKVRHAGIVEFGWEG